MKNTSMVSRFNKVVLTTRREILNSDSTTEKKISALINFIEMFRNLSPDNYEKQPTYVRMVKLFNKTVG